MVDYHTASTVNPHPYRALLLTDEMVFVLEARGASLWPGDGPTSVLDVLSGAAKVVGRPYEIAFEDGWNDCLDLIEVGEADTGNLDRDEVIRLSQLDIENLFHEILVTNPGVEHIQVRSAWTCSRMRNDGFDGSCLTVTRRGFLWNTASDVSVGRNGTIKTLARFTSWNERARVPEESGKKKAKKKKKKKRAKGVAR